MCTLSACIFYSRRYPYLRLITFKSETSTTRIVYFYTGNKAFVFLHCSYMVCTPGTSARVKVEVVFRVYLRAECRAVNGHTA